MIIELFLTFFLLLSFLEALLTFPIPGDRRPQHFFPGFSSSCPVFPLKRHMKLSNPSWGPVHPMQEAAPSSTPPGRNAECVLSIHRHRTRPHFRTCGPLRSDAGKWRRSNCGDVLWAWGRLVWCCGVNGLKEIDGAGGVISGLKQLDAARLMALIAGFNHFPSLSISLCHPPYLSTHSWLSAPPTHHHPKVIPWIQTN